MKKIGAFLMLMLVTLVCCGCGIITAGEEKLKDLDFTVVSEERQPEELRTMIEEKKHEEFKLTYIDSGNLYICIGYGEQETGGYSISVKELYSTESTVYVDTSLMGPTPEEEKTEAISCPYIVLKTENLDKTVVFH